MRAAFQESRAHHVSRARQPNALQVTARKDSRQRRPAHGRAGNSSATVAPPQFPARVRTRKKRPTGAFSPGSAAGGVDSDAASTHGGAHESARADAGQGEGWSELLSPSCGTLPGRGGVRTRDVPLGAT